MTSLQSCWVVLLFFVFLVTGVACADDKRVDDTGSSIVVKTTPELPLLDVVFLATTSVGQDRTLYISSTSNCQRRVSPICTLGRSQVGVNFNSTTCIFNVTSESLDLNLLTAPSIPVLFWCSSVTGTNTSFERLQMNSVQVVPGYAYYGTETTFVFNQATPVGTTVGLYVDSSCETMLDGLSLTTLQTSRELTASIGSRMLTFACASIPTVFNASVMAVRLVVSGASPYELYTTQGVRHRAVFISSSASFHHISLSTDPQCLTLAQPYQATVPGNPVLRIEVPRGKYYFCGVVNRGVGEVGVFVPAKNLFEVFEYGIQPHTMYAAHATQMSFSLDSVAAKSSLQGALFSTPECGADGIPPVKSWSQSMTWTIGLTGTYYACVRTADSTVAADMGYVNQVVVSNIPAVSLARQPAITGVGELATVTRSVIDDSPSAVVAVGLSSTADCTTVFTVGHTTETGNSASFYVPESSPGVVYYCVSNRLTTDLSGGDSSESTIAVFYPLGSLELRTYSLSYPPLRTQATMEVGLDSDVVFGKGTFMRLTPAPLSSSSSSSTIDDDDACDAARKNVTMDFEVSSLISKLSPVLFPVEGNWLLCVREPSVVGGAYVRLRTLSVYGDAVATPSGVIVGLPATLSISAVPPSTTVSLTSDSACSTSMPVVATAQSSLAGTASLSFTYTSLGSLLLCVGYRGEHNSQGTPAQLMGAGTMESTHVRVVPPLAVASVATQLTFSAPGAALLNGYIAVLVPPSAANKSVPTTCPTSATAGLMQLPISVPPSTSTGAIAVASFTPSIHMVGTAYLVCVGADESFVPTGTITVIAAPAVTTDPSALVFGLPAHVTFSREIMSLTQADAFAVIKTTDDCTSDLGVATVFTTGSVTTSTGAAEAFVAPLISTAVTSVRLCVAQKQRLVSDTLGYADAGVTELTQFTSVTRYAQRERPNTLVGKPLLTTSTLFLVRCNGAGCGAGNADAACSSSTAEKYITNSQSPLTAPVGTYFLCQGVSTMKAVVGANTTVEVVEPFQMRTSADTSKLRVYVPFAVSISGGPGGAGAKYTVNVRPASIACGASAAESQSFVIGGDTTEITITDLKPMQDIRFCVEPSSVDSFEVLTGTLQHYMAPVAVIGDRATTLRSGGVRSGATAVLSRTADCLGVVVGGGATPITDAKVTFSVASCGANAALTSLYYCEAVGGGAYASRGSVGLLRSSACSGGADASIAEVDAAPGAAIRRFGIDAAYLTSPRLSASSDCSVLLDAAVASVGYAPGVEERAAFYVCATLVGDAGVTFTTAHPTLRVANWAVSPTAAVSRYNATMGVAAGAAVRVNYATPSSETFWSTASDCSVRTASAAGLSGSSLTATYKTTGVRGLVYVCTVAPLTGAALAVAQFLSVTPPAVRRVSPAVVRGGEYRVTLVVEGAPPLYSMVPGADSGYMYSGYYLSASRDVYLSGDACLSVLAGTKEATVASSGSVSFATAGIAASVSTVSLCAVTAAGRATVLSGVVVAPGHVYPTTLVSGALDAPVYVPAYPGTTFQLSASAKGCGSAAGMPSFTTDAEGYGAVDLVGGGGDALAPGTYTLCYGGAALESVKLVRASHFDVRGTTFVVGVASTVPLLQDLTAAALVPGFSTVRSCTSVSTEHGTWAAVTSTSVSVTAKSVYTDGLYLCARAPVNGTLVALPGAWSEPRSIQFVESSMQLPSAGWDACTTYTLDQCYPPGASESAATSVMAVVHGDCCSASRQSAVVGRASMASGTCELSLDYDRVAAYPAGSTYHVCVWDSADDSVCTTVSEARVSTNCTRSGDAAHGLSRAAVAGIIVTCVVVGLIIFVALIWCLCTWCRRKAVAAGDSKAKNMELTVSQGRDDDTGDVVGYVVRGRHPLLYYPSASALVGCSVSTSLGHPSVTESGSGSLVEEMEDADRDQMALQEARARYNIRLQFAEETRLLELAAKNDEADGAGLYTTFSSGDSYLCGVAQPEYRPVESILTEEGPVRREMEHPANAACLHHTGVSEVEDATLDLPEERDIDLTADAMMSIELDPITGDYRKVCSQFIESAPRVGDIPAMESYVTNDDFEEQEEEEGGEHRENMSIEVDIPDSETSGGMRPPKDSANEERPPPRKFTVRRFTNPVSCNSRRGSSLNYGSQYSHGRSPIVDRRGGRAEQPHVDPLAVAALMPKSRSVSKGRPNHSRSPPQGEMSKSLDSQANTAFRVDDTASADSTIFSHSPIVQAWANDLSGEVLSVGVGGAPFSEAVPGNDSHDESEDDLLSFTTTQRFYDEKRFVLEEESSRRQRLWNWEEEERAQLAQDEFSSYMAFFSSAAGGGDTLNTSLDGSENNDVEYNDNGDLQRDGHGDSTADDDDGDEQVYYAPRVPAVLPLLPPAPRPQALQNSDYHVVSAGGPDLS